MESSSEYNASSKVLPNVLPGVEETKKQSNLIYSEYVKKLRIFSRFLTPFRHHFAECNAGYGPSPSTAQKMALQPYV
jgi:hypothetical protein